jgi:hypothetical protein
MGKTGVSVSGKIVSGSAEAKSGNYTMDNSGALAGSFKVGQVTFEGSVNLAHATMAAVYTVQAVGEYITGKAAEWIDSMNPFK